jgi:hypothetical protein
MAYQQQQHNFQLLFSLSRFFRELSAASLHYALLRSGLSASIRHPLCFVSIFNFFQNIIIED